MFEKIVEQQLKASKLIIFILVILLLGGVYIASNLQIDPSFSNLVPQDSEFNTNDRKIKSAFGVNDAVLLQIKIDKKSEISDPPVDLLSEPIQIYLEELPKILAQSQYVVAISPIQYSEDNTLAEFVLSLKVPTKIGGFTESLEELNYLKSEIGEPAGINTIITGLPVLLEKVTTLLITDNLNTILITLVLIFGILLWYFKSLKMTILTTSAAIIGLLFLGAGMVLFDVAVTITLAAVGVLALGLGADYSIHIAIHFKHHRQKGMLAGEAIITTIEELWKPITASFLTTLAGFTALMLGVSPSSQSQGMVLALSITIIYLVTLFIFPVLLYKFTKNIEFKQNQVFVYIRKFFAKLAVFQAKRAWLTIGIVTIVTVIMLFGAAQVKFSTSNSNWIPSDDPVSQSFRESNYAFGASDTITIILESTQGDLRDVQTARDVAILKSAILQIPNVDSVTTPYDNINYDYSEIQTILTDERYNQFNEDYTLTRIQINSQNLGQDDAGNSIVLKEVRELLEILPIHHTKTSLYGDPIRFEELGQSLQQDAGITTMIGLVLVFVVASIIYTSISVGFIALVPIIISVLWAVGLMGYLNVPFTSLSTGIISLVLGVGVDFSIHLVDSIKKEFAKKKKTEDAIEEALFTSGSAILLSSFTTFFGFLALTFAQLLGTQRLGFSLAFSIISVFFVSITLVPAILAITRDMKIQNLFKQKKKNNKIRGKYGKK